MPRGKVAAAVASKAATPGSTVAAKRAAADANKAPSTAKRSTRTPPAAAVATAVAAAKVGQRATGARAGLTLDFEAGQALEGFGAVVGVDEAGRGPLAGPLVAGACCWPAGCPALAGITDSKLVAKEKDREKLYAEITNTPGVVWAVCVLDHEVIDELNILEATMEAMRRCVEAVRSELNGRPNDRVFVAVDGNRLPKGIDADRNVDAEAIVKGDGKVFSIAAASILAKVTRDRLMNQHAETYPQYGFDQHKGYGVAAHMAAIHAHGPSPIHRKSFNPVRTLLQWTKPKATKPALEAAPAAGADAAPNGKVAAQAAAPPKTTAAAAPTRAAKKKPTAAAEKRAAAVAAEERAAPPPRTTKLKAGGESTEPGAQATQPPKPRATNALRSGK